MSGFIHIAEKPPVWRHLLSGVLVIVPLASLGWYLLADEGLPMSEARPGERLAGPRATLPAPALRLGEDAAAPADATHTAAAAPAAQDSDTSDDYATRNAGIDTRRLSATRPLAVRSFLNEVLLAPNASAGFVVAEVLPDSRHERLGLRPGDVVYTLDTPKMAALDEGSMVALVQQSELELEVYRAGTLTRLHLALDDAAEGRDAAPR